MELPPYASDRYRFRVLHVGLTRFKLTLHPLDGDAVLAERDEVTHAGIAAALREMVREADSDRRQKSYDPVALAASLAALATQLATITDDDSEVARAFDGDWASVYSHVADGLEALLGVIKAGAEAANTTADAVRPVSVYKRASWERGADHSWYAHTYVHRAGEQLKQAADEMLKGDGRIVYPADPS